MCCITRSFTFASDPGRHVCEVQLVHKGMLTARQNCNAHMVYAKFRSALELLETFALMGTAPHVEQGKLEVMGDEWVQQRDFVMKLDRENVAFVERYQRMLGILPAADTDYRNKGAETVTGPVAKLQDLVRSQQQEIAAQRAELELMRKEMNRQCEQMRIQLKSFSSLLS